MTAPVVTGSITQIQNSSTSGSQSISVPSDAELCLVLISYWIVGGGNLSSASLGGNAFTSIGTAGDSSTGNSTAWRYIVPSGFRGTSQTLAWTFASMLAEGANIFVVFLKNVDTSGDPIRGSGAVQATGNGTSTTPSFASDSNDTCFCVVYSYDTTDANGAPTGAGQTEIADSTAFNGCQGAVGSKAGVSSTTTMAGAGDYRAVVGFSVKGSVGGTTYNQSVSGAVTSVTGAAIRRDNKPVTGAVATITGASVKCGNKAVSGQLSTVSGTASKRPSRALSGAVSTITATLTSIRSILRSLSGSIPTINGGVSKRGNKAVSGQLSAISGTASKRLGRALGGAVSTITATLTSIRSILRSLNGSVGTIAGGVSKRGNKAISGQISTISGTASKRLGRAVSGQLSVISATLTSIRSILRSLNGSVGTITGGVSKRGRKVMGGQLSAISGTVGKRGNKVVSGQLSVISGTLGRGFAIAVSGAISSILGTLANMLISGTTFHPGAKLSGKAADQVAGMKTRNLR